MKMLVKFFCGVCPLHGVESWTRETSMIEGWKLSGCGCQNNERDKLGGQTRE